MFKTDKIYTNLYNNVNILDGSIDLNPNNTFNVYQEIALLNVSSNYWDNVIYYYEDTSPNYSYIFFNLYGITDSKFTLDLTNRNTFSLKYVDYYYEFKMSFNRIETLKVRFTKSSKIGIIIEHIPENDECIVQFLSGSFVIDNMIT